MKSINPETHTAVPLGFSLSICNVTLPNSCGMAAPSTRRPIPIETIEDVMNSR